MTVTVHDVVCRQVARVKVSVLSDPQVPAVLKPPTAVTVPKTPRGVVWGGPPARAASG